MGSSKDGAFERAGSVGVVCALPGELGGLREHASEVRCVAGLDVLVIDLPERRVLATVAGVGKVFAAQAATVLLAEGAQAALLCVGTCGALSAGLAAGSLVHGTKAIQADFAVRDSREFECDATWRARWQAVAPGAEAQFLTADRPVISLWRRWRLQGAYPGRTVADMETAAVAAVASRADVPFAALKVVTDRAGPQTALVFGRNYRTHGGSPADTVLSLLNSN